MKVETFQKNLGRAVATVRASRGMTQADLARGSKLRHASQISTIERGMGNPTARVVFALAQGLHVKVSALMTLAEHPHGPAGAVRDLAEGK